MKTSDFAEGKPALDPLEYFTGHASSNGFMENRGGAPTQVVTTQTTGRLVNGTLQIEQDLQFSSGKNQHRSWQLRRLDAHRFQGSANDIVGLVVGESAGNVFHWEFTLELTPGNPFSRVHMSQWMTLQPDGRTLLNHSTITKFGIVVAQVTENFYRERPL